MKKRSRKYFAAKYPYNKYSFTLKTDVVNAHVSCDNMPSNETVEALKSMVTLAYYGIK